MLVVRCERRVLLLKDCPCLLVQLFAENRKGNLRLIQILFFQCAAPTPKDLFLELITVFASLQICWLQLASLEGQTHFLGEFQKVRQLLFELLLVNLPLSENYLHKFTVAVQHYLYWILS